MADANPQPSKTQTPTLEVHPNNTKSSKHFIYKATFIALFLVLLPLFPSQPPEFFTQSRSWEILQLIFVGIAVSYGLFSKKDGESEKEFDNSHSYVSKLLQVSSVFEDDESESSNVLDDSNNNKVENWNYSQYSRVESVVAVAKENPKQDNDFNLRISEKPLLLPVRSLKNRVGEITGENSEVLRSPIPWQSRLERIEMMGNSDRISVEDPEVKVVEKSRSIKLKESLDIVGKKSFSSTPPAPPPPPSLAFLRKQILIKSNSSDERNPVESKCVGTCRKESKQIVGVEKNCVENIVDKKDENIEEVLAETSDDDNDSEEDYFQGSSVGPDVDKKADEFIAKFREQIRQQRFESVRGLSAHGAKNSL